MELKKYLEARGESYQAFAARSKGLTRETVRLVAMQRVRPRADTALDIINTSQAEPTKRGGTVTLRDLAKKEGA